MTSTHWACCKAGGCSGPFPCACCPLPCIFLTNADPKNCGGLNDAELMCAPVTQCTGEGAEDPVWGDTVKVRLSANIQSLVHSNREKQACAGDNSAATEWYEIFDIRAGITLALPNLPPGASLAHTCDALTATATFKGTLKRKWIVPADRPDEEEEVEAIVGLIVSLKDGVVILSADGYGHHHLTNIRIEKRYCGGGDPLTINGIKVGTANAPGGYACLPYGNFQPPQLGAAQVHVSPCNVSALFRAQTFQAKPSGAEGPDGAILCFDSATGCGTHQWLHIEVAAVAAPFHDALHPDGSLFCGVYDLCGGAGYFWPKTFPDIFFIPIDPTKPTQPGDPCGDVDCDDPCYCQVSPETGLGECVRNVIIDAGACTFGAPLPCFQTGPNGNIVELFGSTWCVVADPKFPGDNINFKLCNEFTGPQFCQALANSVLSPGGGIPATQQPGQGTPTGGAAANSNCVGCFGSRTNTGGFTV